MKRKKIEIRSFSFCFFLWLGLFFQFFLVEKIQAKTITVNGAFDDWLGIEETITDSLASYPFSGTTYYYNLSSNSWQTSDPGTSTCMANYDQMMDIGGISLTNDNNYLYLKVRRGSDFTSYFWQKSDTTVWGTYSSKTASGYNSNPCAGKVIKTPTNFNRSLVFSFDKNTDKLADYYLVFSFSFPEETAPKEGLGRLDENFFSHSVYLFKDDGDSIFESSGDTQLAKLESGDYDISTTLDSTEGGVLQEMKVDLTRIMDEFEIGFGDTVSLRVEIIGGNSTEETSYANYTFVEDTPIRLVTHIVDKTRKAKVKIVGKTAKNSAVNVFVNGIDQGKIKISQKGKFSKRISLFVGSNRVRITSQNKIGTKSTIRTVERKTVRAIDRPLGIGIIHSENKTKKSTLKIWGKAYGVSRIKVLVDEVEWGWSVVNTKTGKYEAKIRLSEGLNTIKVIAEKNNESVTATKVVEKI